jgi:hypothetical protein
VPRRMTMRAPGKAALAMTCLVGLVLSCNDGVAAAKTIACPITNDETLTFNVPSELGRLPQIDFDYPSKVTIFGFRDRSLLVIAVDEADPSRVRIAISAQLNRATGTYNGQFVADFGGSERQLNNGPVICRLRR